MSAWTVAFIPKAAKAPRTMPQGNQRNFEGERLATGRSREGGGAAHGLCAHYCLAAGFCAHSRKGPEDVVCQDIDALTAMLAASGEAADGRKTVATL